MRPYALGAIALLLFVGLSPGPLLASPQAADESSTPLCSDCHDQAKAFTGNPHARAQVKDHVVPNAVCESCHGNGTAHIEGGGDKTKIIKPAGVSGADICLKCHDVNNDRRAAHTGFHANSAAVNCLSCHSIHSPATGAQPLLVKPQLALCSSCHITQAASFRNKPYAHRIGRGGMECSSCHEPHSRPGLDNLKRTKAGEAPCLNCHADKRGPFVFTHGALGVGECTSCHEVHGSSNPRMLKRSSVDQLCLECHSPITHDTLGSQPPSFHNLNLTRFRNCTTCHVAIHGSNSSPQLLK